MKKTLVIGIFLVSAAASAKSKMAWKPAKTDTEFKADYKRCVLESFKTLDRDAFAQTCMELEGHKLVEVDASTTTEKANQ